MQYYLAVEWLYIQYMESDTKMQLKWRQEIDNHTEDTYTAYIHSGCMCVYAYTHSPVNIILLNIVISFLCITYK